MRIGITANIVGHSPPPLGASADWDEEFDKPETVETIEAALRALGHEVEVLGDGPPMLRRVLDNPPDFVFNFAEGTGASRSREARVPAVLEMLGIPHSGSDPLVMAVTLDKDCTKRLAESAGVRTPRGAVVSGQGLVVSGQRELGGLGFPLFVKPAYEGSSKGVDGRSVVDSARELEQRIAELHRVYKQPVLVEEFIGGDEVTVGVIGNDPPQVLGMMRVLPKHPADQRAGRFVYSLESKRDWRRLLNYETPARISSDWQAKLEAAALAVVRTLGCRDVSRVDFRMKGDEPYFLEVNPLPGLHPENSDLVMIARGVGMSHAKLIQSIFLAACKRQGLAVD